MLSAPLDQSTDLGNGCLGTRALLQGNEGMCRLTGSECILLGHLRLIVEWRTVGACPDLNCGRARSGSIGYYSTNVHQTCNVLLHYDGSKRCVCPLYKFVYSFKVVKLFLEHSLVEVPMVVTVNSTIFWGLTAYSLIEVYLRFGWMYGLYL
jgi:hypothetical protein